MKISELEQLQCTDPFCLFVSAQTKIFAQCSHRRRNAITSAPPRTQEQQTHEQHQQSPLPRKQEQQQTQSPQRTYEQQQLLQLPPPCSPTSTAAVQFCRALDSMHPKLDLTSVVTGSVRP